MARSVALGNNAVLRFRDDFPIQDQDRSKGMIPVLSGARRDLDRLRDEGLIDLEGHGPWICNHTTHTQGSREARRLVGVGGGNGQEIGDGWGSFAIVKYHLTSLAGPRRGWPRGLRLWIGREQCPTYDSFSPRGVSDCPWWWWGLHIQARDLRLQRALCSINVVIGVSQQRMMLSHPDRVDT
jgi:hypothetical protein